MSEWPAAKARRVLAALLRIGWAVKRASGTSHKVLARDGWPDYVFSFHDGEEVGPRMLARIARRTGSRPRTSERAGGSAAPPNEALKLPGSARTPRRAPRPRRASVVSHLHGPSA